MTLRHSSPRGSGIFLRPLGISQTVAFLFFYKSLHRMVPVTSEDADLYTAEFHAGSISMLEKEDYVRLGCSAFFTPLGSAFFSLGYLKCFPSSGVMLIFNFY